MARILVIDDDIQMCEMLAMMLGSENHEVAIARDGAAGIRLYRETPFDVVLCDIFMPGKEGLETICELREHDPGVRVIAISGGAMRAKMDFLPLAKRFGAIKTLSKPIGWQELLEAVDEAMQG
ncbi:MAG TPA: response regulator [Candidatus Hydrogenedentes bacterium]|nr:response regulator [Candidatus Hydrogenedentota bacterium]HOV73655.1 response regulator [Candidatus Hydrogenedentota bacterium]HPC16301.1 response regulator [Candidatus Hydrogenedentota bacterium]HRT20781.1 response regulator [Candidatus Hydrogenedentota bacterium]HRT66272.1 response regulator [Candidatus Hydrogenedentota bacterium]